MQVNRTARSWTFTSFSDNLNIDRTKVKYAIYQREIAPDTGREHWQGYVTANASVRLTAIKNILGDNTAHVEIAKGNLDQNYAYCTKLESRKPDTEPIEIGERKSLGQGKRNDLQLVVDAIENGDTIEEIAEAYGTQVIKYNKGIQALIDYRRSGRDADTVPEILIYWGDSGTGKTRKATEDNPHAYILSKPNKDGNVWWDGYQGEDTVIFDEFYGWIPYDMLLRVCDRYPLRVPFKGGFHKLKATRIIFTSNKPWQEWYPNIDDKSAFERRLKEFGKITQFKKLEARDVT